MDSWIRRPQLQQVPVAPRMFPNLDAGLVGISDRVLGEHRRLYERYCSEMTQIAAARATPPPPPASPGVAQLLDTPVQAMPLQIEGRLAGILEQIRAELLARGFSWFPAFYLGEADFWTSDQAVSINVPWYLANDALWDLVNGQDLRMSEVDVLRILRHETGHALGYAFELWKRPEWWGAFGEFFAPYADAFTINPASTDFVRHLHEMPSAPNAHYAQKHPDEDWAETFAVWLDPGARWREDYAAWPGALAKLEAVDLMLVGKGLAYGAPVNTRPGRRVPFTELAYTVGEFLGQRRPGAVDAWSAAVAREPEVSAAIALHEVYFETLVRGGNSLAPPELVAAVTRAYGSPEAWWADLRALAAVGTGWAVTTLGRDGALRNHLVRGHADGLPAGEPIIAALDLHEHAYAGDVGTRKDVYVAAWHRNLSLDALGARLRAAMPPPLPQPWGVLYAPPNADGSRKACGNCYLLGGYTSCAIHAVPVTPEHVCGYHLFGVPATLPQRLPVSPIDPALSGLALVPGGTSCDRCRYYIPQAPGAGQCAAVGPGAAVEALGCCGRWEPTEPLPAALP